MVLKSDDVVVFGTVVATVDDVVGGIAASNDRELVMIRRVFAEDRDNAVKENPCSTRTMRPHKKYAKHLLLNWKVIEVTIQPGVAAEGVVSH